MTQEEINGVVIYRFDNLSNFSQINQFISTRKGGVSKLPYDTLNLSFASSKEDAPKDVLENHKRLASTVGVPMDNFVFSQQTHSANVAVVTEIQRGAGVYSRDTAIANTDAMITNKQNLALAVFAADCVPILLFDPVKLVIGAVHSGWKGTALKILTNTVNRMSEEFGTDPKDLIAGIGPSIGPESYEVDLPVIEAFEKAFPENDFFRKKDENHANLNLWEANAFQLKECGVPQANIEISGIDTFTNPDMFFSDRYTRPTGRFIASIVVN